MIIKESDHEVFKTFINHRELLVYLIKEYNLRKIIEVGVYKSEMIRWVMKHSCGDFIDEYWEVDSFTVLPREGQGYKGGVCQEDWDDMHLYACSLMKWFPQLKIIKASSVRAASIFDDNYFDMIYLDASHIFSDVLSDIKAWHPKIKKGGIFSGHDYNSRRHLGVNEAVHEFFDKDCILGIEKAGVWILNDIV